MRETKKSFGEFLLEGVVSSLGGVDSREVVLLRDTGAAVSLIRRVCVPNRAKINMEEKVMLGGFPNTCGLRPLLKLNLDSQVVSGEVKLAVVDSLPVDGVDIIVGIDLALSKNVNPVVKNIPAPEMVVTMSGSWIRTRESSWIRTRVSSWIRT